ncbi:restriction endonuclease subunit S [Acinetobacter towneri]|uniref:restriction endonuclease subunit S n=1 Tax=Acinetobacter towneri TaxID=202956 RepID=UPI003211FCE8
MAKYRKYAEYQDSGVEFLPILPSTWKVGRVKSILDLQRTIVGEKSKNYQLLSLTLRGVIPRDVSGGDGKIPESFDTYQAVKKENLVFCLFDMDETPRTVGISEHDGMITGAYNVYKVNGSSFPKFIYYYFLHLDYFKGLKPFYTGLRKVVRSDTFANIKMPCPPLAEQTQIANFLDHETTKIDHLIEKQQQLIELLKEKRQAVISHAVTKGLDPNVPMKDSGVEWLGEVPEHWKIIKGGYIGTLFGSESIQEDDVTDQGSLPFIKVSSLSAETFKLSNIDWFVSERRAKFCKAEKNYIVFPKRGAAIFTNKVNVIEVDSVIDPNLMGWKIGKQGITEYFALLLKTRGLDDIADVSTVPQINNKHIAPEKFPLPSLSEQCEIVKFVGMELTKFDEMILKAESAIQLMQERRTALISAAVTGKIDVRNWQAPTFAEAHTELSA